VPVPGERVLWCPEHAVGDRHGDDLVGTADVEADRLADRVVGAANR